ncbi:MAG: 3-hydroxyacyl-[acyl-carrier-protein] dehydratase FabZ [Ferrovum sp. 37-45-19]|nr:MAG: 3-hydroxyacyl-[acyl-carrier-protein] dehydratase FabZ [Ferrovum sp. 21-44-67]OYV95319.1 MAG: 3-hydroxyacyl-[acyl-carrier-protein] dehydratase FabZ [Ferrovum sp. 37-45-19]OZB33811.1 MAG: 3-hydroxyacyl-[acyl-carrier-protein] dehydratase FabZ [Ferrovum sp. 34-44-207]
MDIKEVMKYLPHRYPFLLIDKVIDLKEGEFITAVKNVTMNEDFFQGHFPGHPVMPGVLIIEAMAQAAALLSYKTEGTQPNGNMVTYFIGIDKARFRAPVFPGDQLILKAKLIRRSSRLWKYETQALVDDKIVSEAELLCTEKNIAE